MTVPKTEIISNFCRDKGSQKLSCRENVYTVKVEMVKTAYRFNKPAPKKRFGKRIFIAVLATLFTLSGYSAAALNKDFPAVAAEKLPFTHYSPGTPKLAWPTVGQSAVGSLSDGVLANSAGSETQKPIASITKLVTVLALLEKQPLNPGEPGKSYTIGPKDVANYQNYVAKLGSVIQVSEGQVLSEHQVLQSLLLVSANNIADSIAVWEFGSIDGFLVYANQFASKNGWENTVIADASGFSADSKSTPSDLIKIGQKALQNPVIAEIVAQLGAIIPGVGTIKNTNQLLSDANVVGVKTGTTDEAGSCLLFAVKYGPSKEYTMLAIIMGQPSWPAAYQAARTLRDSALEHFKEIEIAPAGTVVGTYKTTWGQQTQAITAEPLSIYGWVGKQYSVEVLLEDIKTPTSSQQVVGSARALENNTSSVNIVTQSAVDRPNVFWQLTNYW